MLKENLYKVSCLFLFVIKILLIEFSLYLVRFMGFMFYLGLVCAQYTRDHMTQSFDLSWKFGQILTEIKHWQNFVLLFVACFVVVFC